MKNRILAILACLLIFMSSGCGGGGGGGNSSNNTNDSADPMVASMSLVPVNASIDLPDNRFGVTADSLLINSFVSDEPQIIDSDTPSLVSAESADGDTVLLGYAFPESAMNLAGNQLTDDQFNALKESFSVESLVLSPESTSIALVMLNVGGDFDPELRALLLNYTLSDESFDQLLSLVLDAYNANPYFLDSMMSYTDIVALVREIGSRVVAKLTQYIAENQPGDATGLFVTPRAVVYPELQSDFNLISPWDDDEPWYWYGTANAYSVIDPPFLAATQNTTDQLYALANPTNVRYAAEYYDLNGNLLAWDLVPRNSTLIQKMINSYAAQRKLTPGQDIDADVRHIAFRKYFLSGGANERHFLTLSLHAIDIIAGVVSVVSDVKSINHMTDTLAAHPEMAIDVANQCGTALMSSVNYGNENFVSFLTNNVPSLLETVGKDCALAFARTVYSDDTAIRKFLISALAKIGIKMNNPVGWGMLVFDSVNNVVPFGISLMAADDALGYDLTWDGDGDLISVSTNDAIPQQTIDPIADFSASYAAPLTYYFDASASKSDPSTSETYSWEFGDGETGSGINVSHTYSQKGVYLPTLTVNEGNGKTDVTKRRVEVLNGHKPVIHRLTASIDNTDTTKIRISADISDEDGDIETLRWYKDAWNLELGDIPDEVINGRYRYVDFDYPGEFVYAPSLVVVDSQGNMSDPASITVATGGAGYITQINPSIVSNAGGTQVTITGQNLDELRVVQIAQGEEKYMIDLTVEVDGNTATFNVPEIPFTGETDLIYSVSTMVSPDNMRIRSVTFNDALYFVEEGTVNQTENLVAYYPFDDNVKDYSGFGNNGQAFGGLTFETGVHGQAARFNGIDSFIKILGHPSLSLDSWTISFWMKPITYFNTSGYIQIFSKEDDPIYDLYNYAIVMRSTGSVSSQYEISSGYDHDIYTTSSLGTWSHIVATRDNVTGEHKLYKNGILQSQGVWLDTPAKNSEPIVIGHQFDSHIDYFGHDNFYNGLIDDLRLYNHALSEGDVINLFQN